MWKTVIASIAAMVIATASSTARPNHSSELGAAVGGFVTGLVVADLLDSRPVHVHVSSRAGSSWDRYSPAHRYPNPRYNPYRHAPTRHHGGYFEYRNERVWVPGYWDHVRTRHGDRIRVWVEGRWEIRRVKVWVPATRPAPAPRRYR